MNNDILAIEEIANATSLDPDEVSNALRQIEEDYGPEEVKEALDQIAPIPTGEGLTKKEAKKELVRHVNSVAQAKNRLALSRHSEAISAWEMKVKNNINPGRYPASPYLLPTFGMRHIDKVVFLARQYGGYGDLLKAAGYDRTRRNR